MYTTPRWSNTDHHRVKSFCPVIWGRVVIYRYTCVCDIPLLEEDGGAMFAGWALSPREKHSFGELLGCLLQVVRSRTIQLLTTSSEATGCSGIFLGCVKIPCHDAINGHG